MILVLCIMLLGSRNFRFFFILYYIQDLLIKFPTPVENI